MKRGVGGTLAVLIASLVAGAGHAQAPASQPTETTVATAVGELDAIAARFDDGDTEGALKRLDKYIRTPRPAIERAEAEILRGYVLLNLDREEEALAAYGAAARILPDNPAVLTLQFDQALVAGYPDTGEAALSRLIDAFPETVREMAHTDIHSLLRAFRDRDEDQRADALIVRLAGIGFGNWEVRPWLAMTAARLLLARGEVDEATSLIGPIASREVLETALVQKQFAQLWPALEAQAGSHMERAETAAILRAERRLAEKLGDVVEQRGLVRALREARRFDEAERAVGDFAATPESMRQIDEDGGWLVDDHARLLHEAGRKEEAYRRYAAMRAIDIEEKPWLINMVINRISRLVGDRRFAEAEPLLAEAPALAEKYGSPYAQQLVRKLKVCAAQGLGRRSEAEALGAELMKHADDAPMATIDGLVCLDRLAEAEERVIAVLGDAEDSEYAIMALQPATPDGDEPSLWTEIWTRLRDRPAVAAAFGKVGRDLPESMRPPSPSLAAR